MAVSISKALISEIEYLCDKEKYREALDIISTIDSSSVAPEVSSDFKLRILKCRALYYNQKYDEVWKELENIENKYPSECLNDIGFIGLKYHMLFYKGELNAAIQFLNGIDLQIVDEDVRYFIKGLYASYHFWKGEFIEANDLFQECYKYYLEKKNYEYLGDTTYSLGGIAFQRCMYKEALQYIYKSLDYFRRMGSKRRSAVSYLLIGIINYRICNMEDSVKNLRIAAKLFRKCGDVKGIINVMIARARVLMYTGKYFSSKKKLKEANIMSKEANYSRGVALSLEFLGEILLNEGSYKDALEYLKRAEHLVKEMAPEGDIAVEVYRRLGEAYIGLREFDNAERYLSRAYKVASRIDDRLEYGAILRCYGLLYAEKGNFEMAYNYFKESISAFKMLEDRYELARTYLYAGNVCVGYRGKVDSYYRRFIEEAISNVIEATYIFSDLGIGRKVDECRELIPLLEKRAGVDRRRGRYMKVSFDDRWLKYGLIVTRSEEMAEVISRVETIAPSELPVLIVGETGTGKELIARLIHKLSARSRGPFVAVNCASIPETMFESELFGHRRGAFTGADRDHVGLVERASGGTLFLDEISELTNRQQASLLRVLQEKMVKRIGETEERTVDIRLVTASNESIRELFNQKKLRMDFYYRISTNILELPPLRERREDIYPILSYYISKKRDGMLIEEKVIRYLEGYFWPGNVRELVNLAEVLMILGGDKGLITKGQLPQNVKSPEDFETVESIEGYKSSNNGRDLKEAIISLLDRYNGNKSAVARKLGISRTTLYRKMQELGIE